MNLAKINQLEKELKEVGIKISEDKGQIIFSKGKDNLTYHIVEDGFELLTWENTNILYADLLGILEYIGELTNDR